MKNQSIIKWRFIWANIWIIGIVYLIIYIGESQVFGTYYSAWIFGMLQLVIGIYYFIKTHVYQFLLVGIVGGTGYWHYEAAEHMDTIFSMSTVYIHLVTLFLVIIIAMPVINKAIRLELHARKLFRLAAETVRGIEDGYTARPYSAGKMNYSHEDVIGLGRYLAGKDIIRYEQGPDSVTYLFSMNISPLVDHDLVKTSTVVFTREGIMSVKIAKKDYHQYKRKLSFDQLCESFASLFRHFIEAYQNNNEARIIDELKSA